MRKNVVVIGHLRKQLFANILAHEDNRFTASFERLVLKKAPNNKVFDHIEKIFDREQGKKNFKDKNEERTFAIRTEICIS